MPVRKIPRKYYSRRGGLYSYFLDDIVARESRLENIYYTYIDWLSVAFKGSFIKSFEDQPIKTTWNEQGRTKQYTLDLVISFSQKNTKSWLCEIKYRSQIKKNWLSIKHILKQGISAARKRGMIYKIISDKEIFLINYETLRFLRTHIEHQTDPILAAGIIAILQKKGAMKPSDVADHLTSSKEDWRRCQDAVWQLAAKGEILCDVGLPRDMTFVTASTPSPIAIPNKKWLFHFFENHTAREIVGDICNCPKSRFWQS